MDRSLSTRELANWLRLAGRLLAYATTRNVGLKRVDDDVPLNVRRDAVLELRIWRQTKGGEAGAAMGHSLHVTRQLSIPAQESRRQAFSFVDKSIRNGPDVSVTGAQGSSGLLDSTLALIALEKKQRRAA